MFLKGQVFKGTEEHRGGSREVIERLYRLIASTTFSSSDDIRYKDKNDKEAKCHANCDWNKKVEVRISKAFFSCRKNKKTETKNKMGSENKLVKETEHQKPSKARSKDT